MPIVWRHRLLRRPPLIMPAAPESISIRNSELGFVITEYLLLLSPVADCAGALVNDRCDAAPSRGGPIFETAYQAKDPRKDSSKDSSKDRREAGRAFREKRKPQFKGK